MSKNISVEVIQREDGRIIGWLEATEEGVLEGAAYMLKPEEFMRFSHCSGSQYTIGEDGYLHFDETFDVLQSPPPRISQEQQIIDLQKAVVGLYQEAGKTEEEMLTPIYSSLAQKGEEQYDDYRETVQLERKFI